MTVSVGYRFQADKSLCRGSPEECGNIVVEMGKIYDVEVVVSGEPRDGDIHELVAMALGSVKREHPNIVVNYISYEPPNKIVVQVFDPQVSGYSAVAIIAILALILGILYITYKIEKVAVSFLETMFGDGGGGGGSRFIPISGKTVFLVSVLAASVALPIAAIGYLVRGVRK